jgi:hypothetical protein
MPRRYRSRSKRRVSRRKKRVSRRKSRTKRKTRRTRRKTRRTRRMRGGMDPGGGSAIPPTDPLSFLRPFTERGGTDREGAMSAAYRMIGKQRKVSASAASSASRPLSSMKWRKGDRPNQGDGTPQEHDISLMDEVSDEIDPLLLQKAATRARAPRKQDTSEQKQKQVKTKPSKKQPISYVPVENDIISILYDDVPYEARVLRGPSHSSDETNALVYYINELQEGDIPLPHWHRQVQSKTLTKQKYWKFIKPLK